jgi:hypothetical protein
MLSFGGLIGSTLAGTVFLYDLGTRKLCHQVKATLPVALKRSMVEVIIYQNEIRLLICKVVSNTLECSNTETLDYKD